MALVRYIHLNAVRAGLSKRPEGYTYSGHKSYLMTATPKIIQSGPILKLLGGKKAYERFVLEGMGESHNEEYYAVEDQRFLGEEGFGEQLRCEAGEKEERKFKKPIETMVKDIAKRLGTTSDELKGRIGDGKWQESGRRR